MAKNKNNKPILTLLQADQHVTGKSASSIVADGYAEYGRYVNNHRAIPGLDGWKNVYRRMIQTALELPDRMTKTSIIAGNCMGLHPHGSQEGVVSQLVRWGVFEGQGNHGMDLVYGDSCGASAPRYTEAKINPTYRTQLNKLIDYVPTKINDLGRKEYAYLPTPVPFALVYGIFGIALGASVNIPAFTFKSLIEAHRKQDYRLLVPNYGMQVTDITQLQSLWEDGVGSLTYKYKVTPNVTSSDGYTGCVVEGDPGIFLPNWKKLEALAKEGLVLIRDETTDTNRIFVARQKRVSKITDEDVIKLVNKACSAKKTFNMLISYNGQARPIGIKDWVAITYHMYTDLINSYKTDSVKSLTFDRKVWEYMIPTVDLIRKDPNLEYDVISTTVGVNDVEVIKAIAAKPFGSLHKTDPKDKIKKIDEQIKDINNIDSDKFIDDIDI